jgi:hypothetical protein
MVVVIISTRIMKPSAVVVLTAYNFNTFSMLLISTFQTNLLHESLLMKDVVNEDNNNKTCCILKEVYMFSVISPCKNSISPRCTSATNSI